MSVHTVHMHKPRGFGGLPTAAVSVHEVAAVSNVYGAHGGARKTPMIVKCNLIRYIN